MIKKIVIILITTLALIANSHSASDGDLILKKNEPSEIKDCFEKVNRATFAFNQALDGVIFKPVASVYKKIPSPVRSGVSNSLDNLSNLVTIPNNILQGEFKKAGENTGRLIINTTLGILGIFDVANALGLAEYEKEDYGQTLGVMGMGEGCYLVIPVLGPSTVRDSVGSFANMLGGDPFYNISAGKDTHHFSDFDYWSTKGTSGIDFRAKNLDSLDNLEKNSMDFYASVKSLYLQDRQKKVLNSGDPTSTLDDSDWEEIEG